MGEIPVQSQVRFGVFFSENPWNLGRQSVKIPPSLQNVIGFEIKQICKHRVIVLI